MDIDLWNIVDQEEACYNETKAKSLADFILEISSLGQSKKSAQ
jgi:hypothetical protein